MIKQYIVRVFNKKKFREDDTTWEEVTQNLPVQAKSKKEARKIIRDKLDNKEFRFGRDFSLGFAKEK